MGVVALHSAASGMRALDEKLNVVANNLANINTHGFKRSRVNFEDLLYQVKREPGVPNAEDEPIPHGILVGTGVKVSGTQLNFMPGSVDTKFGGPESDPSAAWKLSPADVAQVVIDLLSHPGRSLPSCVEMRPTKPRK